MKLISSAELYGYGTSEGSKKGWQGRKNLKIVDLKQTAPAAERLRRSLEEAIRREPGDYKDLHVWGPEYHSSDELLPNPRLWRTTPKGAKRLVKRINPKLKGYKTVKTTKLIVPFEDKKYTGKLTEGIRQTFPPKGKE